MLLRFLKAGVLSHAFGTRKREFQSCPCDLEQVTLPLRATSEDSHRGGLVVHVETLCEKLYKGWGLSPGKETRTGGERKWRHGM